MKKDQFNMILNGLLGAGLGVIIYWGLQLFFWQFQPVYVEDIVQTPIAVDNVEDRVPVGGDIELLLVISKEVDYQATTIDRGVICNDSGYYGVTTSLAALRVPDGEFVRKRVFTISDQVPEGADCFFQFDICYEINPIREECVEWISEPFETVRGEQ